MGNTNTTTNNCKESAINFIHRCKQAKKLLRTREVVDYANEKEYSANHYKEPITMSVSTITAVAYEHRIFVYLIFNPRNTLTHILTSITSKLLLHRRNTDRDRMIFW